MSMAAPLRSALRPQLASGARILGPSQAQAPSSRSFSLWPSAKETLIEPTPAPAPAASPPLLLHSAPPAVLDATYLEPLSNVLLSLPPSLGLSYAAFIPIATILLRTTTTLPITLWQRRRTRRLVDEVMPLVRDAQARLSLTTRDECRRAGKSFEEYQAIFKKRVSDTALLRRYCRSNPCFRWLTRPLVRASQAKSLAQSLAWKHSATPILTLIVPPLLHVPIFILTTLTLRDGCTRALTFLGSTLPATTPSLQHLLDLSATPLWWCPSMILPDPTAILPLMVGLAAMMNVELSARYRRVAATGVEDPAGAPGASDGKGVGMSAADRRRVETQRARTRSTSSPIKVAIPREIESRNTPRGTRQLATTASVAPASPANPVVKPPSPADGAPPLEQEEGRTPRIVTNVLRISAVMFIPIAAMAPSAVCAYWLTSNVYTLVQNAAFAWADAGRLRRKRLQQVVDRPM